MAASLYGVLQLPVVLNEDQVRSASIDSFRVFSCWKKKRKERVKVYDEEDKEGEWMTRRKPEWEWRRQILVGYPSCCGPWRTSGW
jgi:hypothetical protein